MVTFMQQIGAESFLVLDLGLNSETKIQSPVSNVGSDTQGLGRDQDSPKVPCAADPWPRLDWKGL